MKEPPKALYDLSVLMDALQGNQGPLTCSKDALDLAADGIVRGYLCAAVVDTLCDLITRSANASAARTKLAGLRRILDVAPVDALTIDAALALPWSYLDDAIAHESARIHGIPILVTLNPSDYVASPLHIVTPGNLCAELGRPVLAPARS
jgi:predicted nucleic acid-binding protein